MGELSTMANAIRTGCFLNPKSTLTMRNEYSEFTPPAAAAMDELIKGGFVQVEANGKARTYSLTDKGMDLPRMTFQWMETHGRASLVQPIRKA